MALFGAPIPAYASGWTFCVIADARRPDLIERGIESCAASAMRN
jgi:hypothetical protein